MPTKQFELGDVVTVQHPFGKLEVKGFDTYPGEYGFHKSHLVVSNTMGLVIEERGSYYRVLISEIVLWFENYYLELEYYDEILGME